MRNEHGVRSEGRTIGFIGIGNIGMPMACRLLDAGHRLHVFDINKASVDAIVGRGAIAEGSPVDVATRADTVLVSLPTPGVLRQVVGGPDGVINGRALRVLVDLSTTGPRAAAEAAALLAERGVAWADAPVSGGVAGARAGKLAVMVSCAAETFSNLEPLLSPIGQVFHVGNEPGMGQVMKLANNLLSAAALAATSEAIVMGVKAGLSPRMMIDVLNAGSGRNSATAVKFPNAILPRSFNLGFSSSLMLKDVALAVEEAEALGVPIQVGRTVRQVWQQVVDEIGGSQDSTTFIQLLEQHAGVTVADASVADAHAVAKTS
ncbi:NAD(P)-dependent oxidoreductase [Candidimonas nitroreducens]|uniref:Oxidoreductase n=1 Tax=Candidimonas nitroreducens TaxID=683354 RepID=A0A225M914_9BURK|nr:NAD(P)-dependent oxidoreductase [Candidimonas nitroreducens]OWT57606.1 oxidoreductase [Candidimonas nitroreducens]